MAARHISKGGLGFNTCTGCRNYRPISYVGGKAGGNLCRACCARINWRAVYFPEEGLPLFTTGK